MQNCRCRKKEEKFAFSNKKVRQVVFGIVKMAYLKALNNFTVHIFTASSSPLNPLFDERFFTQITVGPRFKTRINASLNSGETATFFNVQTDFFLTIEDQILRKNRNTFVSQIL